MQGTENIAKKNAAKRREKVLINCRVLKYLFYCSILNSLLCKHTNKSYNLALKFLEQYTYEVHDKQSTFNCSTDYEYNKADGKILFYVG